MATNPENDYPEQQSKCQGSSVSAAEFVRSFAKWRAQAFESPVSITNHGRTTHVLMSVSEYEQMEKRAREESRGNPFELSDWIDEAVLVCDDRLVVESMNRVASATSQLAAAECIDRPLYHCFPQFEGTLFEVHLNRTVQAKEPTSADIPSPLRPDGWIHLQTFPLQGRNVLMFRDITDEVRRHRLADVKTALIKAMAAHGAVGYVRVNVSGMIERVDEPFCNLVALPEERLVGAKLTDLVPREHLVEFKAQLEMALSGAKPSRFNSCLHSNRGTTEQVLIAMAQLKGAYGAEGAVVILTPTETPPDGTETSTAAIGE